MHAGKSLLCGALLALLSSCGAPPPDANTLSSEIYALGEQSRWADTMPMAKALVLAYPEAAGAHYLLGKAYLHRAEPHLVQATGEFKTALAIQQRTGRQDAAPWAKTKGEFLLAVHRDLALVHFRWIHTAMSANLPADMIRAKLLAAKEQVDAGIRQDPNDSFLNEMRTTIEEYLAGPFKEPTTPQSPPQSPPPGQAPGSAA